MLFQLEKLHNVVRFEVLTVAVMKPFFLLGYNVMRPFLRWCLTRTALRP
jgi:hypothetical protein